MEWMQWAIGLLSTAVVGLFAWVAKMQTRIADFPRDYVPRDQIDARLGAERQERKDDMKEIREQLKTIIEKIDAKADK